MKHDTNTTEKSTRKAGLGLENYSGIYIAAAFILIFAVWVPSLFLTSQTLSIVTSTNAVGAMLALSIILGLSAGVFDLSIGAIANLSAVVVVLLQTDHGWSLWAAITFAILLGVVLSLVNALLIIPLKIPSFIATLGTASIFTAVLVMVSPTQPPAPFDDAWLNFGGFKIGGIQVAFLYMLIIAALVWWLLEHTPYGRTVRAIGGNPVAAKLSGVRIRRYVLSTIVFSGVIAAFAGVVYSSQTGPALNFGPGLLLPAIGAAFLGATQIKGRFNAWGTVIAVYVLAIGVQGLSLVTAAQWVTNLFNGLALVIAVAFAGWRQRGGTLSRRRRPSDQDESGREQPTHNPVDAAMNLSRQL